MANIPLKDIEFPGLGDKYTLTLVDETLTQSGKAADAKTVGDALTDIKENVSILEECVIKPYSASRSTDTNYYRILYTPPLTTGRYRVTITVATAGNHTFQIGPSGSASSMVDTLGSFTMAANTPVVIESYTPSGSGFKHVRNSVADDWDVTFDEIDTSLATYVNARKPTLSELEDSYILYDGGILYENKTFGPSGGIIDVTGQVLWFPKIKYPQGTKLSLTDYTNYRMYIRMWSGSIASANHIDIGWKSDDYILDGEYYVGAGIQIVPGSTAECTVAEIRRVFKVTLPEYGQKGFNERISVNGELIQANADSIADLSVHAGRYGFVKGVNHRGFNTEAPENTLPAFILSKKKGFGYVETDVRYTSDGIPVLLHNETINETARNSDGTEISSEINIADITYAESQQYVFCDDFYSTYPTVTIPKFADFIALCRNIGLHPYIELKSSTYNASVLVDIVKAYGMARNVTWISYNNSLLEQVKNADSSARLGLLVTSVTATAIQQAQALKTSTNDVFIDASSDSDNNVTLCEAANIPLEVYLYNSSVSIRALKPYVSGVTSDSYDGNAILYKYSLNQ